MRSVTSLSKNCLFLICPTDDIEFVLANSVTEQAFFYTALGACFALDFDTQEHLAAIIRKEQIKQVVFVVKLSNTFFKKQFVKGARTASFPIDRALQDIANQDNKTQKFWDSQDLKYKNFIRQYLKKQKEQLQQTALLGEMLAQENIAVSIYHFDTEKELFINLEHQPVLPTSHLLHNYN